ncbi:TRAP-type mannitol/chloroaromatic compound transport system permease small subunit [Natronocella acetinitrilica]|uniref:TRAP transporter small permease protein n=1 Tax=Natronocella acetinitrilica TaxID=414046 RepID=A0AAE3G3C8_9GAMM|nr:TRAP transporter small permease subunit [Natronocella acetinitrilica]MCP1675055.1 TRAP-type mannitol/chloroaromatic compound transport system permease small subunit [Natronocella acetinitrilica]
MLRWTLRLEWGLRRLTGFAGLLACIAMVLMVSLVFGNVLGRYLFSIGATWAQELEWYLMAVTAMLGIAYAMRFDDHVRVDIFSYRFSRVGKLWLNLLTAIVVALPCALLIVYYGWPFAETSYLRNERSPNSGGLPWRFIPKGLIVVGFVFVAIEALRQTLACGRRLVFHYARGA